MTPWLALLTVTVVSCFLAAAAFRLDVLVWVGGLGALLWLALVADLVGSSTGWAEAVALLGLGLAGLGVLIARLRPRLGIV